MSPPPLADRARRCLLAGALGDAWGGPYEGRLPQTTPEFPANATISDDTQLTLATCEAITAKRGRVDPEALAERFRSWFDAGRLTGLGSATLKALRDLSNGAHWALAGARGEYAAGSGAAMRVAPFAFILDPHASSARRVLRDACRITHHNDEAYAGALAIAIAVRQCSVTLGVPPDLLAAVGEALPDTAVRDRLAELAPLTDSPVSVAARFGNTGHVVEAVPLALYIACRAANSIEDAARTAAWAGGDTDTIAALAAQVVGAAGAEVPDALLSRISDYTRMVSIVDAFVKVL